MGVLTLKQAFAQFWLQITNKFVPKESGKGLSTNDYSDADKQKVNSIPTTVGTITGVTAGNGLSGGGTSGAITLAAQVDRGLSIVSDKIGHSNSITSGTASEGGSARTLAFGGTFNVPSVTYDARGHISGKGSVTLTMPAKPTASDVGAVPTSRTVNGKALSSNITLAASDVGALATTVKGAANGVAELDANGKVPSSQLPSYVDDVLEYASKSGFPTTGETGKIYVAQDDNKTYRWSGSDYIEISASLALGTTSSTAFAGDKGNAAYTHAVTNKGVAKSSGFYKITTNSEGHVTAATAVAKSDITALGIPSGDTGATSVGTSGSGNAITGASYDSATRKITLQKDSTFALQGELNTVSTNASNAALTVESTHIAPATNTKYYPVFSDAEATETDGVYKHANISYRIEKGSTATAGRAQLILGNASAVGTAGNSTGYVTLYGDNGKDHRIYPPANATEGIIHTLPSVYGTLLNSGNFNEWVPKKDGTGASGTWNISVSGNANTASAVTSKVVTPASTTKYYLLGSANGTEETDSLYKKTTVNVNLREGSASTEGISQLILGNNIASGTAGNSTGYITLYSGGGGSHRIFPPSIAGDAIHTLPTVGGGTLFSSTNYTSWVPTKDGTGATGTWDISISGTASKAYLDGDGNIISSTYLPLAGGALSGRTYSSVAIDTDDSSFRNIRIISPNVEVIVGQTEIPTGEIWLRYEEEEVN